MQVLALQRWQRVEPMGRLELPMRADSQDTWLFRSPLPGTLPLRRFADLTRRDHTHDPTAASHDAHTTEWPLDFAMGRPRCDHVVAAVLSDAGMRVRNPALDVVTIHMHHMGGGVADAGASVSGRGELVPVSEALWVPAV